MLRVAHLVGLARLGDRAGEEALALALARHRAARVALVAPVAPLVEFALQRPKIEGHAIWIPQLDVRLLDTAEWMENGKLVVAQTKALASAPAAASKYKVRTFYVPGYRFLEYHLPKGVKLPERASVTDDLFYVVQGALKVSIGGTKAEVVSGDTMRAPAGKPYSFEASEGTVLTMIHIPPVTAIAEKKGPG